MFQRSVPSPSSVLKWGARTVKDHIHRVVGGEVRGNRTNQVEWCRNWPRPMRRPQVGIDPPLLMPTWSLLIGLAQFLPHSSWLAPFPQTPLPPTLYLYGVSQSQLITSVLKSETASFSKMLASTNQSTWRFNPKEHHQKHPECYTNLFPSPP
jgi:hypothetical protein